MLRFIDIHGHYAWQIDDGIPTVEEAKRALTLAKAQNIQTIIATPHLLSGHNTKEIVNTHLTRIQELKQLAADYDIIVYPGSEVMLNSEPLEQPVIPLAHSHYLLCEFDVRKSIEPHDNYFENWLHEVILLGYRPIVAHVERYFHQGVDCERISNCIDMGCFIQVNSTSLLANRHSIFYKNAIQLLEHNFIHIVASDTHRATPPRHPNLYDTWQFLSRFYSTQELTKLFYTNPLSVIKDTPLKTTHFQKRSFVKQWFSNLRRFQ